MEQRNFVSLDNINIPRGRNDLEQLIENYQVRIKMLAALINTAHDPVIVVNEDLSIFFENTSASILLESCIFATRDQNKLRFLRAQHHKQLLSSIISLVNGESPIEFVSTSPDSIQKWWITVISLDNEPHFVDGPEKSIMVVIHDSGVKNHDISEFLRQGYDLKAAEIRLAQALAIGTTPEQYAEITGLKISTIRTQLRSIFTKTNTKGQVDLMRLLSDVPRIHRKVAVESSARNNLVHNISDEEKIDFLTKRLHRMDLMDEITKISLKNEQLEVVLQEILTLVRETFDADRTGLLYPCDPTASSWASLLESTKPEWVTPVPVGTRNPMTSDVQALLTRSLAVHGPTYFDPTSSLMMPERLSKIYTVKSQMVIALRPRIGKPWLFGMTYCSDYHIFTKNERELLTAFGDRLTDMLSLLISVGKFVD